MPAKPPQKSLGLSSSTEQTEHVYYEEFAEADSAGPSEEEEGLRSPHFGPSRARSSRRCERWRINRILIASQPPGTGRQTTLTELYASTPKTERRIMTSSMVAGNVQFHLPRSVSKTRRFVRCRNTGAARGSSKPNVGVAIWRGLSTISLF